MKYSVKIIAVAVMVMLIAGLSAQNADARSKRRTSKSRKPQAESQSQQKSSGINSLVGVWKGSGSGTGSDPRQPGADVSLNADDVKLTIESVRYSEKSGEGRADVIFTGVITNVQGEIVCERSWEYAVPYDMKREGDNSWSFSTEYIDGEDKITLSFMPGNIALIRWEGFITDENYTDEKYTFDVACSAVKN